MNNQLEEYNVLFHARARAIFFSLCKNFRDAIHSLDRMADENVFQQVQARYLRELKRQLDEVAMELLEKISPGASREGFNRQLLSQIAEYTTEFTQKARAL
ncbi:MAG TPA: hypothetical protein VFL47_12840 [Flavisolibacter sp.]|nr:hypothetical protein [Flavisolibacter sp.]